MGTRLKLKLDKETREIYAAAQKAKAEVAAWPAWKRGEIAIGPTKAKPIKPTIWTAAAGVVKALEQLDMDAHTVPMSLQQLQTLFGLILRRKPMHQSELFKAAKLTTSTDLRLGEDAIYGLVQKGKLMIRADSVLQVVGKQPTLASLAKEFVDAEVVYFDTDSYEGMVHVPSENKKYRFDKNHFGTRAKPGLAIGTELHALMANHELVDLRVKVYEANTGAYCTDCKHGWRLHGENGCGQKNGHDIYCSCSAQSPEFLKAQREMRLETVAKKSCKTHPGYKAKYKPGVLCETCWRNWVYVNPL